VRCHSLYHGSHLLQPDLMYYWSHAEVPAAAPSTPGRLSSIAWPPTSPFGFSVATEVANAAINRPGARYTEAGVCNTGSSCRSLFFFKSHSSSCCLTFKLSALFNTGLKLDFF
jgi:hypothetical protein